jgi:hydrogenase-4 component B
MMALLQISVLTSFAVFLVPKRWKYPFILLLDVLLIICTTAWAMEAFQLDKPLSIALGVTSWSGELFFLIDPLSSFFILVINLISFSGMLYAGGYLNPYLHKKSSVSISLHLFSFLWLHIAMLLVASFQDGLAFLLGWELMSLFSFVLVIFEGEKENTLKTGINYLLQMHLGFALIMFGFLVLQHKTGSMNFAALKVYFSQFSNTGLFLLFFTGFGIKAGFIPLHTWLPKAHPAAPSHVSGVMSGVMIKMGIYGILRIVTHVQQDLASIGSIVLIVSIISGVLGVVFAIMQHDLKRLLAYHSIENIGIIGMGIGLAILGAATNDPRLTALGMAGALLHVLNHALFKSLLFFSAGNVYYAARTVNMDHLGGVAKSMRITSILFLIGALAISGIPPFNGFISEFLLYSSLTQSLTTAGFTMSLAGLTAFISLVLIGGLCVFCFTKAFGLTFLGTRRSEKPEPVTEVPKPMLIPSLLLAAGIVCIGFFGSWFTLSLIPVLDTFGSLNADVSALQTTSPLLKDIGLVNVALVVVLVTLLALRKWQQKAATVARAATWGCGYSAADYRHQYTPTSFADSLRQMVGLFVSSHNPYTSFDQQEIFPAPRKFRMESYDRIEKSFITKLLKLLVAYLPKTGFTQTGVINHYLIYPLAFLIIIGLLTFLNYL